MSSLVPVCVLLTAPFFGNSSPNFGVRLLTENPVVKGRCSSGAYNDPIRAVDLIPVRSWLRLRGKCRKCYSKVDLFCPILALAVLGIAIWATLSVGRGMIIPTFCFRCVLLTLSIIDARTYVLPDLLTLGLVLFGLAATLKSVPATILDHIIGATAGFAVFSVITALYERLRGRAGLVSGNAKLPARLGAWVSWKGLPELLALAAFAGLAFVVLRCAVL